MTSWPGIAARNNAEWCDAVCRSSVGASTLLDQVAWTSSSRTPLFYPDAVTLVPELSVPDLLARLDVSAGCSIKDSFASLDLTVHGFTTLFDAQWIVCTEKVSAPIGVGLRWQVVREREDFEGWVDVWRGEDGPSDVLRADLLDQNSVKVLAGRSGDQLVAGAVATASEDVVGVSNIFAIGGVSSAVWSGCLALVGSLFGGSPIVGYESGETLATAHAAGFRAAGPLRVWRRNH